MFSLQVQHLLFYVMSNFQSSVADEADRNSQTFHTIYPMRLDMSFLTMEEQHRFSIQTLLNALTPYMVIFLLEGVCCRNTVFLTVLSWNVRHLLVKFSSVSVLNITPRSFNRYIRASYCSLKFQAFQFCHNTRRHQKQVCCALGSDLLKVFIWNFCSTMSFAVFSRRFSRKVPDTYSG